VVLDSHRWLELRRFRSLLASGAFSLSEVARETGLDRKTVRKYLSAPGPATPPRQSPNGRSKLVLFLPPSNGVSNGVTHRGVRRS
jgi:transposase